MVGRARFRVAGSRYGHHYYALCLHYAYGRGKHPGSTLIVLTLYGLFIVLATIY